MMVAPFTAELRSFARLPALAAIVALVAALPAHADAPPKPWASSGGNLEHTRAVLSEIGSNQLNPTTVKQLKVKWTFETAGDVSATPTVEEGGLYVPDWGGMLWKLDPKTGDVIWSRKLSDVTKNPNSKSRSSPAIVGDAIIIGDMSTARVMAFNKATGALLWITRVDSNVDSLASTSATVYNDIVYFGIASREESLLHPPTGGFRGSVVALNATTGAILWRFTTVPAGYTGGAVVPAPVVDTRRHSLYISVDNNYSIPDDVHDCVVAAGADKTEQIRCMDPSNYVDAIVALDLDTGALKWGRRFEGADTWTKQCNEAGGCDQPPGADNDFASSPNLFQVPGFVGVADDHGGTSKGTILGIGGKSGIYRAINPENGGLFWSTMVGQGGIQWGSAIDLDTHSNIYVAVKNDARRVNYLTDYHGNTTKWTGGSWGQLDAFTGKINWQIPAYGQDLVNPNYPSAAPAPLTFTNYILFAGSTSGYMTAISSHTGFVLWKFQSGGTVLSSPAIFDDWVYWGTGYGRLGGKAYNRLYAFSFK